MKIKNPRSFKQHKEDKESIIQQLLEEMIETTVLENLEKREDGEECQGGQVAHEEHGGHQNIKRRRKLC